MAESCSKPQSQILTWKHLNTEELGFDVQKKIHTHTLEYYSAIKKNEIMPFAATWMDLEITILSEAWQWKTNIMISLKWNLKNDTNELIYKREIDSQIQKINLQLPKGKGAGEGDKLGVWN